MYSIPPGSPAQTAHGLTSTAAPAFRPDEVRRKLSQGVAKGFVDLSLGEIAGFFQDRAGKICPNEPRAREIGALEQRIAEIRASEIGTVETRIREIGIRQVGHFEICSGQRGEAQRGVAQPREGEIDRSAADRTHLALAGAQTDARQIWREGRILRAPLVPQTWATAQGFEMFGVRRQRHTRNGTKRNSHERGN